MTSQEKKQYLSQYLYICDEIEDLLHGIQIKGNLLEIVKMLDELCVLYNVLLAVSYVKQFLKLCVELCVDRIVLTHLDHILVFI